MTGFEPGSSGIGSDPSANCATTTAPRFVLTSKYLILYRFTDANYDLRAYIMFEHLGPDQGLIL